MIADIHETDTLPRLRLDVPAEHYHRRQIGVVTTGALKAAMRSPAHYRAWVDADGDDDDTPDRRFGRMLHAAVLEPMRFAGSVAVMPAFGDCRFKAAREARDSWRRDNAGREWIEADDASTIGGIALSLSRHPIVSRLLCQTGALVESTIEWTDELTGLRCKCRPDWWHRGLAIVLDIKTAQDASPRRFGYAARDFGYDLQQAHYLAGIEALGETIPGWLFAVAEKERPYACAVYRLDADALDEAREARREAMLRIARGIETGEWPAYGDSIETLAIPRRRS